MSGEVMDEHLSWPSESWSQRILVLASPHYLVGFAVRS